MSDDRQHLIKLSCTLPFSLTRSFRDCHFTSNGIFVIKALYLLAGLAYGSKRFPPLFTLFSFLFSFWLGRSPSLQTMKDKEALSTRTFCPCQTFCPCHTAPQNNHQNFQDFIYLCHPQHGHKSRDWRSHSQCCTLHSNQVIPAVDNFYHHHTLPSPTVIYAA